MIARNILSKITAGSFLRKSASLHIHQAEVTRWKEFYRSHQIHESVHNVLYVILLAPGIWSGS